MLKKGDFSMRAYEFLKENASSGATSAGNVAAVAMPQLSDNGQSFFGVPDEDFPPYGSIAMIRRVGPTAESNKKGKKAGD